MFLGVLGVPRALGPTSSAHDKVLGVSESRSERPYYPATMTDPGYADVDAPASSDPDLAHWVAMTLGKRFERSEVLVGGMSSIVQRCFLDDGLSVVVRHIVDEEWLAREPDLIGQEADALQLLEATALPTPRLLAADSQNRRLMMSWLHGEMRTESNFLVAHVDQLADMAARIASVRLAENHSITKWCPWVPTNPIPPSWGDQKLWASAIASYQSSPPQVAREALLHRDLHPLNVLWTGDEITGVVDWVNACVGHPHAELGHCRWNLAVLAGVETADRFLARYLASTDFGPYENWWDIVAMLGFLPGPIGIAGWHTTGRSDLTRQAVVTATEQFLESVLD